MKKLLIILLGLIPNLIFAQQPKQFPVPENPENELKEVIIQGNRMELPFTEIARDIQVIPRKELENLPAKSINEVLAYISGVDIRQRGPFGTQTDLSIDGGTSEQAIVLINGVKMTDSQTAHNMMNIPVPLSAIEQIEVLRGAAARIYGINALTGAVNIVTRKSGVSFITATLQAGSSFKNKEENDGSGIYAGGSAEVTGNFASKNQQHLLALSQSEYNGQRYNSAATNTRLFYNGNLHLDAFNSMHAMAGYAASRFGANGFYAAPGDRESEELVRTSLFSLSSKHHWGNFMLSPRISNRYGEDDYRYFKNDLNKGRSKHFTNALMLELNSSLTTDLGTFGFGLESRLEEINSSNIGQHQRNNHGAYAELASGLGDNFHGTLGFYANYNSAYGWQWYPGFDFAYLLNSRWTISASVGAGQRIPSFTDLFLNQLPGNVGNPALKPENAWSYEANLQYQHRQLKLQAGAFTRNITDFIDWTRPDAANPYSPANFGKNKVQGIYGRIKQQFELSERESVRLGLSYNYLSPSLEASAGQQSKYVLESLKHQLIGGVSYQKDRFSLQLENRWLQRELAEAYFISDLRLNYQWQNLLLFIEGTNLFNAEYSEAGAVPMPSRWVSTGLKYHWQ